LRDGQSRCCTEQSLILALRSFLPNRWVFAGVLTMFPILSFSNSILQCGYLSYIKKHIAKIHTITIMIWRILMLSVYCRHKYTFRTTKPKEQNQTSAILISEISTKRSRDIVSLTKLRANRKMYKKNNPAKNKIQNVLVKRVMTSFFICR